MKNLKTKLFNLFNNKIFLIVISSLVLCSLTITTILDNNDNNKTNNKPIKTTTKREQQIDKEINEIDKEIEQLEEIKQENNSTETQEKIKELNEKKQNLQEEKKQNLQEEKKQNKTSSFTKNNTTVTSTTKKTTIINSTTPTTSKAPIKYKITANPSVVVAEVDKTVFVDLEFSIPDFPEDNIMIRCPDGGVGVHWISNKLEDGIYITGRKAGKSQVIIYDYYNPDVKTTINVTVNPRVNVTGIKLDKTLIEAKVGQGHYITATVIPENAVQQYVHWSSTNPEVATVHNGYVGIKGPGTATIIARTHEGNYTASCIINATSNYVDSVEITTYVDLNYYTGDTVQLKHTIYPYNATNKNVTWSSTKPNVATVDQNGFVKVVGPGIAYIRVTTEDGNKWDSVQIYVPR